MPRVRPGRAGHVRAVVALAPTSGDNAYGLQQFALRANRLTIPLLLTAGRGDGMGGFAGLTDYGNAATGAPRLSVVAEGATHCHVYIPVGSECSWPGVDRGYMVGRCRLTL